MMRFHALALAAAPIALAAFAVPATVSAQAQNGAQNGLAQVTQHLRATTTMTANFTQTDRRGQSLSGDLTLKRPGRIRFEYGRGTNMLIVGDGRALTMVDYDVNQVQRWPINDSPLSVLLNPDQDLSRFSRVVQNDRQVLMIEARDPRRPEFGTINVAFAKVPSAPAGLMLTGWTTLDAQNNRTTVRLANQRFNVTVADSAFRYTDPRRRGPRG